MQSQPSSSLNDPADIQPVVIDENIQSRWYKQKKFIALILLGVFILIGSSASAYYGYYLPNKPQNKLIKSVLQLSAAQQFTVNGSIARTQLPTQETTNFDYVAKMDTQNHNFDIAGDLQIRSAKVPLEVRRVDGALFFKTDLAGLRDIDNPSLDPTLRWNLWLLRNVKNQQWYKLDNGSGTALGVSNDACDSLFNLSSSDKQLLKNVYKTNKPFTISKTETISVGGQTGTKYDIKVSDPAKLDAFLRAVKGLDYVSNVQDCLPHSNNAIYSIIYNTQDYPATNISAFVNRVHQLKKLELSNQSNKQKWAATMNFNWSSVSIDKPSSYLSSQGVIQ